ncbi:MAG: hypothetical protein WBB07_02680 [Mycobacterium sp.]
MRIEIPDLFDVLRRIDERGGAARGWFFEPLSAYIFDALRQRESGIARYRNVSPAATQEAMSFPLIGPTFLGYERRKHYVHRRVVQRPSANDRARTMWITC